MEIKAIFLDVDGTLVSFDTHRVPRSAIETLQDIHQLGIKIIIATGRSAADLHELVNIPYDAVVALNGADCVLKDGTPVVQKPISIEDFMKIQSLTRHYGCPMAVETNQGVFVNELSSSVIQLAELVNHPLPQIVDLEEVFRQQTCCQLCIYCDESTEKLIMAHVPGLSASRWSPYLADVNVAGVDKAFGLEVFCKYYGFDLLETVSLGDGGNDIAMLKAAGWGIAMGGASDLVKASADYVTDTVDNDGIKKALKHLLNREKPPLMR